MEDFAHLQTTDLPSETHDEVLQEIIRKANLLVLRTPALVIAILAVLASLSAGLNPAISFALALGGGLAILVCHHLDRSRKTTVIMYQLEPALADAFGKFVESMEGIAQANRFWVLLSKGQVLDQRYHAGADRLINRKPAMAEFGQPKYIKTNLDPIHLGYRGKHLYFYPDRILLIDQVGVHCLGYGDLVVQTDTTRFIESESLPEDAKVVDWTWRFVNKDGKPDRRFNNNIRIPICSYDQLILSCASGEIGRFQASKPGTFWDSELAVANMDRILRSGSPQSQAQEPLPPAQEPPLRKPEEDEADRNMDRLLRHQVQQQVDAWVQQFGEERAQELIDEWGKDSAGNEKRGRELIENLAFVKPVPGVGGRLFPEEGEGQLNDLQALAVINRARQFLRLLPHPGLVEPAPPRESQPCTDRASRTREWQESHAYRWLLEPVPAFDEDSESTIPMVLAEEPGMVEAIRNSVTRWNQGGREGKLPSHLFDELAHFNLDWQSIVRRENFLEAEFVDGIPFKEKEEAYNL